MERLFAVASSTIVAPAPDAVTIDRAALLEGYSRFREIIDGYAEPARPSLHDVESVAAVLSASMLGTLGQNTPEVLSAGSAEPVQFTDANGVVQQLRPFGVGAGLAEGRSWRLRLAPGVVGMRTYDVNAAEKTAERTEQRRQDRVVKVQQKPDHEWKEDADGVYRLVDGYDLVLEPESVERGSTREITEFSARSRSRMVETVGSLDFSEWSQSDGALAMVTLTLPAATTETWLAVAPDGKTFKKLLKRFQDRWRRAIGQDKWRCLWKLEFMRRGAPHWHALMRVPALVGSETFEEWLSRTWCEVVDHPDPEERAKHLKAGTAVDFSGKEFSDPRRISQYFLGHSSKTTDGKEYQHIVPEAWQAPGKGPGRFWGNPGLTKAVVEIDLTEADANRAARILRKVKRARDFRVAVLREQGTAKREGKRVPNVHEVKVKRSKPAGWRGRAAHRTYRKIMRKRWVAELETGAWRGVPFVLPDFGNGSALERWQGVPFRLPENEFRAPARFRPQSLGGGGYAVGGWVLVNDGLQLGLDLARFFDPAALPGGRNIAITKNELIPASRRHRAQCCTVTEPVRSCPLHPSVVLPANSPHFRKCPGFTH
jgi:hypothetical protein